MVTANRVKANISDDPLSIAQALRRKYADQFMADFAEEISSLNTMQTFIEFIGKQKDHFSLLKQYSPLYTIQTVLLINLKQD